MLLDEDDSQNLIDMAEIIARGMILLDGTKGPMVIGALLINVIMVAKQMGMSQDQCVSGAELILRGNWNQFNNEVNNGVQQ